MTSPSTLRRSVTSRRNQTGIAFLDDDHVLSMVRRLLTARTEQDWAAVAAFFAPDVPDRGELRRLRVGLQPADGVAVRPAVEDPAVLVVRRAAVTRALIESSPSLRLIQRLGGRRDGIDLRAASDHGVEVSCQPRPSLVRTAEHTILLMLALAKRLPHAQRAIWTGQISSESHTAARCDDVSGRVAYNWAGIRDIGGVSERTLGVVGLGEVGMLVAERAQAFGMRVLYTGRTRLAAEQEARARVAYRPLPALLAESDVVSLHVPGSAMRGPVIGRDEIAAMRPGALLVNTSRGWLVDEDALYEALSDGRLGGAGLDVHLVEPRPPGDRFCRLDNVVLTPHVAGGSRLAVLEEVRCMFDNIRHVLASAVPPHGRVVGAP